MSNNSNKNKRSNKITIIFGIVVITFSLIFVGYFMYDDVMNKGKDIATIATLPSITLLSGAGIYFFVKKGVPLVIIKGIVIAICTVLLFVGEFFGF